MAVLQRSDQSVGYSANFTRGETNLQFCNHGVTFSCVLFMVSVDRLCSHAIASKSPLPAGRWSLCLLSVPSVDNAPYERPRKFLAQWVLTRIQRHTKEISVGTMSIKACMSLQELQPCLLLQVQCGCF